MMPDLDLAALRATVLALRGDMGDMSYGEDDYGDLLVGNGVMLALLDRLETAEAERARIEQLLEHYAREYPRECNKRVAAEKRAAAAEAEIVKLHEERHGSYRCCEHCADDPAWHAVNVKDTHEAPCSICDEAHRVRALELGLKRSGQCSSTWYVNVSSGDAATYNGFHECILPEGHGGPHVELVHGWRWHTAYDGNIHVSTEAIV